MIAQYAKKIMYDIPGKQNEIPSSSYIYDTPDFQLIHVI